MRLPSVAIPLHDTRKRKTKMAIVPDARRYDKK
jgi:hypothetical protein